MSIEDFEMILSIHEDEDLMAAIEMAEAEPVGHLDPWEL